MERVLIYILCALNPKICCKKSNFIKKYFFIYTVLYSIKYTFHNMVSKIDQDDYNNQGYNNIRLEKQKLINNLQIIKNKITKNVKYK